MKGFIKRLLREDFDRRAFLKWKRDNVTYRGIKELGKYNEVYGSFGKGLYTAPLSNKSMAKSYGKLYYVVGGKPENPMVVSDLNRAEILRQTLVTDFCKEHGKGYDTSFFEQNTSMDKELMKKGYDGLIIKGREMVNYKPDEDKIRYFETDNQLEMYYEYLMKNN